MFGKLARLMRAGQPLDYTEIRNACIPLLHSLGANECQWLLNGIKEHDDYTYAHSVKVAAMLAVVGRRIGMADDQVLLLAGGGLLHDVGKMIVPLQVLNKPGRLQGDEWAIMKGHVAASVRYLQTLPGIPDAVVLIAGQHHEKLDGSGYPFGLTGAELNELARISSIADIFSALTDPRAYKSAMPAEQALCLMETQMKTHLDCRFLEMFKSIILEEGLIL